MLTALELRGFERLPRCQRGYRWVVLVPNSCGLRDVAKRATEPSEPQLGS